MIQFVCDACGKVGAPFPIARLAIIDPKIKQEIKCFGVPSPKDWHTMMVDKPVPAINHKQNVIVACSAKCAQVIDDKLK